MGVSLLEFADTILGEVILLQEKFKAVYTLLQGQLEGHNLPFEDFPYEFRSRLVALLPPRDCVSFKLAGKTATNYVKTRGQFSAFLLVVRNSSSYKNLKTQCFKNLDYDITSTSFFLKSDNWYVKNGLYLNLNSVEKFDHAVEIISGSYHSLQLDGPYTWKQALHFMNLSKQMRDVMLHDGMLLEVEDFDDFFEAIVQYCKHQERATLIIILCPDLTEAFAPQFKEYVENRTTFTVMFWDGNTIVYRRLSSF
uniref:F-box domain-containing protein n=1 Tax=Panagrellus redivivus TaxID=6233 RepID=A0A7E4ZW72_PANRE